MFHFFLLAAGGGALGAEKAPDPTRVRIDSGWISGLAVPAGTEGGEVRVYRGIPYAAPPVGRLRWRPPAPPAPWKGVRACVRFGPPCPQPPGVGIYRGDERAPGEDCLFLNVWSPVRRPARASPGGTAPAPRGLPVMVWIHGGGNVIGSGAMRSYDGTALARRGVVVVTLNYRLGPFGFLSHPLLAAEAEKERGRAVSGNYGLLDQMAALRWVRRNIAAFGGDPERVTVFGESAGGLDVSCLMVSPLAKGLFQRAIAESGAPVAAEKTAALEQGKRLFRALGAEGAEDPLAVMRGKSFAEVLAAARPSVATLDRRLRYGPSVDGWVLPDDPRKLWREGRQHDVPFLAGWNADDGGIFSARLPVRTPAAYRFAAKRAFGEDADEVLALFPVPEPDRVAPALRRLLTISVFASPITAMVRSMEKVDSPGRLYRFSRVCPAARRLGIGAAHGLEIPYVFGTGGPLLGFTEVDRKLSDAMQRYWVNFAATGDPNGEGLPPWAPYNARRRLCLDLGDSIRAIPHPCPKECGLFDRIRLLR